METTTVGKVLVTAKVQNLEDLYRLRNGIIESAEVRSVEVTDALVGGGMSSISLPRRLVAQLGLSPVGTRKAWSSAGTVTLLRCSAVRLTIYGRDCHCEVLEVPDDCPVLVGRIALGMLDFVVDPVNQRLIGNPEHGGEHMIEMY